MIRLRCLLLPWQKSVYLSERDRIPQDTLIRLLSALDDSVLVEAPFDRMIAEAMQRVTREEIPEFADRVISAFR